MKPMDILVEEVLRRQKIADEGANEKGPCNCVQADKARHIDLDA